MNRILALVTMSLIAVASMAQTADIEVCYNYRHFHRSGSEQNHPMILLANAVYSKFYSPMTEYLDSLEMTPQGKEVYNQMKMGAFASGNMKDVPKRSVPMYVFKSKEDNTEVFDGNITSMFRYSEPYAPQEWVISDSVKNILGYECVMATADYHGRHWTAWFSPEIPIQDGPWKLTGLPGLILEAGEEAGQHHFIATGIAQTTKQITPNLGADHYETTDRISMLKALRKFEDNPIAGLSASLGIKITVKDGLKVDDSLDFLETDYR